MKTILHCLCCLLLAASLYGQVPMKSFVDQPHDPPRPFEPSVELPSLVHGSRQSSGFSTTTIAGVGISSAAVKSARITSSGSYWIAMHENALRTSGSELTQILADILPGSVTVDSMPLQWEILSETPDAGNIVHIRMRQTCAGLPIVRQDIVLHVMNDALRDVNGFAWTSTVPDAVANPMSVSSAELFATNYLRARGIAFQEAQAFPGLHQEDRAQLCWFPQDGKLHLAYEIRMHPNILDAWMLYVDATTGNVLEAYTQRCAIYPAQLYQHDMTDEPLQDDHVSEEVGEITTIRTPVMDGPSMVMDLDLLGQSRLVHGYLVGTDYFMIDASRTGMYSMGQSVMPNTPVGVIWTIDGQNGSPQQSNFEVSHVSNVNNNWAPLEVSAHFNAGESYQYFLQTFGRNSLNGDGGNIISIINIRDENGDDLDNAFWSGTAMFYGNGDVAFKPLARALDVAGHEMSHGVIQNTAGLEYMGQSGAMNESFADVFGAMIDRDDWKLGEDVVQTTVFPSGALRDLSNPHNGGNGPQDNGWQPQHMNEYQNLPNTPEGDNGGVHVNSGIPNRAFFLFATSVGKEKAEQVYYKALRDYLVKSSQFIDLRNAVEKAAADLYGAGGAEVLAARSAFDAVGIGAGQGNDHQDDLEVNPGADFVLATDELESDLYWVPPSNPSQFVKLNLPAPLSRPSFTDDGTAAVYVDQDNEMILITFDWSQGLDYEAFYLEQNPQGIWRNVVVSKDGSKIAYTTASLRNEISVYDFFTEQEAVFTLYNPTTATGISTGDVLFADVMEWDYSGEYIMYDALNRIESAFGDGISYWNISFIRTWDNGRNGFGDGFVGQLFNSLPENISIGNPSFAKNSPYIITFDLLEEYYDIFGFLQTDYRILAANIEAGYVNLIYENTTIGYPSYSRNDDKILFTYDEFGDLLLATIDIQPGDKTLPVNGTDVVFITGAQKGVWFQTGTRSITGVREPQTSQLTIYPNPALDVISLLCDQDVDRLPFRLTDIHGNTMLAGMVDGNRIDARSVPAGIYVIHLEGNGSVWRSIVVKAE